MTTCQYFARAALLLVFAIVYDLMLPDDPFGATVTISAVVVAAWVWVSATNPIPVGRRAR